MIPESLTDGQIEIALVALSIGVLGFYHWRLRRRLRYSPESTAMGRHRMWRKDWLELAHQDLDGVLVVQTLRNWIMAATFLASTSILLSLGLLGAAFATDKLSSFAQGLNFLGSTSSELLLLKALVLLVDFLAAFFNFSMAIRFFLHTGFSIVASSAKPSATLKNADARELELGAFYYTLGMRCFYFSLPLTLWVFGPTWMLVGSVILVLILSRVD